MKNKKIEKIYGDPKKLSIVKKAGKAASSQPNFSAATSLWTKYFIKSKLQPLKFRIKVVQWNSKFGTISIMRSVKKRYHSK